MYVYVYIALSPAPPLLPLFKGLVCHQTVCIRSALALSLCLGSLARFSFCLSYVLCPLACFCLSVFTGLVCPSVFKGSCVLSRASPSLSLPSLPLSCWFLWCVAGCVCVCVCACVRACALGACVSHAVASTRAHT
jgi:hypothetical protein